MELQSAGPACSAAAPLHSGCRYGVTFYDLVISVFMAVGRSADGLCKLVTLRGSCGALEERIRALLQLMQKHQRQSALFWRQMQRTQLGIVWWKLPMLMLELLKDSGFCLLMSAVNTYICSTRKEDGRQWR